MRLSTIYAQIEAELKWRQDEVRFFQNLYNSSALSADQLNQTRRTLVLLLYAHFEGFVKFVLILYVDSINSTGISCAKANHAIVAATLSHIFKDLRNPDKKSPDFRSTLPDDSQLHRIARDQEFVEKTKEFNSVRVAIPSDYVDTESNLKPVVLKKNLFKLGFDYSGIDSVEGSINRLLGYRNAIAHGSKRDGISQPEYDTIFRDTYDAMDLVRGLVIRSLRNKEFKRTRVSDRTKSCFCPLT